MFVCKHEGQYYETDRMGITHHSNYVQWMEKGQNFFLRNLGWPYEKLKRRVLFLLLFLFRVNTKLQQLSQIRFL